jgi:hypothetical protein
LTVQFFIGTGSIQVTQAGIKKALERVNAIEVGLNQRDGICSLQGL